MRAVALNCWLAPMAMAVELGEIWMDEIVVEDPPFVEPPDPPPEIPLLPPLPAPPPQAVSRPERNKSRAHSLAFIPSPE